MIWAWIIGVPWIAALLWMYVEVKKAPVIEEEEGAGRFASRNCSSAEENDLAIRRRINAMQAAARRSGGAA